jgi:hypothetical protein
MDKPIIAACSILCPNGKRQCVVGGICTCCDLPTDHDLLSGSSTLDTIGNLDEIQSREKNDISSITKYTSGANYNVGSTIITIPSQSLVKRTVSKICYPKKTTDTITKFEINPINMNNINTRITDDTSSPIDNDYKLLEIENQKPTYMFIIIGVAFTVFFLILLLIYYFNIDFD